MAAQIIKGRDLMLFDNQGKSYAYATNHTLSITAETTDISSKDHGIWGANEVSKYSWEITSENLYTTTSYDAMFDAMVAGVAITVRFGLKALTDNSLTVADGDYQNWTATSGYYEGKVFITSLVANANNGENATYSVTLTGSGKITRNGTAPSNSGNSGNNNSGNNNSGNSNNGDIITYGQASYNNNVTINGTSYNVAGGSVSVTNSLRSISITGSNMNFVYLHYGNNNEAELSINNAGTSASWSGAIYSTVQVYHGNGDIEDPEDKLWFTIEVTSSGQLVDDPDGD